MYSQKELVEKYTLGVWFVKIRLISCRRQLWANEVSLIHLENATLQLRKICEMIAYLCVTAAGLEVGALPKSPKGYKVGEVFKYLQRHSILLFPRAAQLSKNVERSSPADWHLNIEGHKEEDVAKIKEIHERSHRVLHEFSPFRALPDPTAAPTALFSDLNAIRGDHQWLWNRFWHHAIIIKGKVFFVNLGETTDSSRPQIVKDVSLLKEDLDLAFDPEYLADFSGSVDWAKFDDSSTSS